MNRLTKIIAGLAILLLASCTQDYNQLNSNPNAVGANVFDPDYLLSTAEWGYANTGTNQLLFEAMWSQCLSSTYYYYSNGDKYAYGGSYLTYVANPWDDDFTNAGDLYTMQQLCKGNAHYQNLSAIGEIMKICILQRLTDEFGDIPYSQALQAADGITDPAYDAQSSIYPAMLASLDSAIQQLSASAPTPTADVIYSGNIAEWQKFGYTLMLRMAMRLVNIDASDAQKYAEEAATGGTFTSNSDNAFISGDPATGFSNGTSNELLVSSDFETVKWTTPFIDSLRYNADPRLGVIGEIAQNGAANNANESLAGNTDSSAQLGMPNGYDQLGGTTDISNAPGYPGPSPAVGSGDSPAPLGYYSRPTAAMYMNKSGPNFILTYAESELLLAEAAARGWSVSGTAATHYANAVAAAMESLSTFGGTVTPAQATTWATAHPLITTSQSAELEQINTQYWLETGTTFNFIENWINWKRTGYPTLTPVNYPGNFTGGTIPRRIIYPQEETSTNEANYSAEVAKLTGGDAWTTKTWWDTQ